MDFNYTHALVCESIPNSLVNGLSLDEHEPIDLSLAMTQHKAYLDELQKSGLKLIKIQSDEKYPDCVFVEDTCIALGNKVFITNPGAESRRGETRAVREKLEQVSADLGLEICAIKNLAEAFIDGGDCVFTGKEFIIGLSARTNQNGVDEFKEFFSEYPVTTCQVVDFLHLKSLLTMLSKNTILISTSSEARKVMEQIKSNSKFSSDYKFVCVSNNHAANVLLFNGVVMTCSEYEDEYAKIEQFNCPRIKVENTEFKKLDGCLTCRCVFFNIKIKQ